MNRIVLIIKRQIPREGLWRGSRAHDHRIGIEQGVLLECGLQAT
jgi:hypothetical protein